MIAKVNSIEAQLEAWRVEERKKGEACNCLEPKVEGRKKDLDWIWSQSERTMKQFEVELEFENSREAKPMNEKAKFTTLVDKIVPIVQF